MRATLVVKVLEEYSNCPRCNKVIMGDEIEVDDNIFTLECSCDYKLKKTEQELEKEF